MNEDYLEQFILQLLEGFEGIKEALSILLYSYQKKAESDSKSGSCECKAEEIRRVIAEKVRQGKVDQIKKLLKRYDVERFSELKENDYNEFLELLRAI